MERYGCGVQSAYVNGFSEFSSDIEARNEVLFWNPGDLPAGTLDPGTMVLRERSMNCQAGFTGGTRWISNDIYQNQANPCASVVIENRNSEITNHSSPSASPYLPVLNEIFNCVFGGVLGDFCNPYHSTTSQITSYVEECQASDAQNELVFTRKGKESMRIQLLNMLQMVDDRCSRCLDEIDALRSSFCAIGDQDTCFALKTITHLNEKLRNKIKKHVVSVGNYFGSRDQRGETSLLQHQWILQQLRRKGHQLWRPQRGLPERSVSILRAWMFQNFIHPYPNDSEKQELAIKSGLARRQVSNWFINARVRLWKPLIEEMYVELRKKKVIIGGGGLDLLPGSSFDEQQ